MRRRSSPRQEPPRPHFPHLRKPLPTHFPHIAHLFDIAQIFGEYFRHWEKIRDWSAENTPRNEKTPRSSGSRAHQSALHYRSTQGYQRIELGH